MGSRKYFKGDIVRIIYGEFKDNYGRADKVNGKVMLLRIIEGDKEWSEVLIEQSKVRMASLKDLSTNGTFNYYDMPEVI